MSDPPLRDPVTAVLYAPNGATGALRGLVERLIYGGIAVTVVDDHDALVAAYRKTEKPPAVLVDLRDTDAGDMDDWKHATETVRRIVTSLVRSYPIAITDGANASLIVACIHAGAADVIDLSLEGIGVSRAIVQRIYARQAERNLEFENARQLRAMVEDLVKDLVRTERRSIDLELSGDEARDPTILLVLHEREIAAKLGEKLQMAGVMTRTYKSGEDAVREARELDGIDLALVGAQLPGIDGLETVRRLRDALPGVDAFLVTSVDDGDLAADAADLGVVGFVQDPLANLEEVVTRLSQLAREALQHAREHLYVERIKERHERVLARYRALPREG